MSSDTEVDTSRTVVQTYVPAYQREAWDDHAEELDMSRSEFVKTMVQAGRRGFGAERSGAGAETDSDGIRSEESLRQRIVESLESQGPLSWDQLREAVAGDIEERIEGALGELQSEGTVRHSGPKGGYVLEASDE